MSEFELLLPCPGCGQRIPDTCEQCPHCHLELTRATSGVALLARRITCPACGASTAPEGPCVQCGAQAAPDPGPVPPRQPDPPPLRTIRPDQPILPSDHIANPLRHFMNEKTMIQWGFNYELRRAYLIIGVGCFFLFRLFFALLFWEYKALFHPFNIFSDLIHGVLVGGLVGMRGSGAGNGAKTGAVVGFTLSFLLLVPIVFFALIGLWVFVPAFAEVTGKALVGVLLGGAGASAIKSAIVGAFIGFYIDHARP